MPDANKYNGEVAMQVRKVNQAHISTETAINDNSPRSDIISQVEPMALKNADIVGGNGNAAATLGDLGYEPTLGAGSSANPKKARKTRGEGLAAGAGVA